MLRVDGKYTAEELNKEAGEDTFFNIYHEYIDDDGNERLVYVMRRHKVPEIGDKWLDYIIRQREQKVPRIMDAEYRVSVIVLDSGKTEVHIRFT